MDIDAGGGDITLSADDDIIMEFGGDTVRWDAVYTSTPPSTTAVGYIRVVIT